MTVEAVIWDFGGVFTSSPFEAFARYEAEKGAPKDIIRRVNATNHHDNAWALFERNEIDAARFDTLFLEESTALGFPIPGRDVLPLLAGRVRPRMVEALKTCKQHFCKLLIGIIPGFYYCTVSFLFCNKTTSKVL